LQVASLINPYLVNAPTVLLPSRISNPPNVPLITKGSQPTDGGFLVMNELERQELINNYPQLSYLVKEFIGGEELINGLKRYCLWLKDVKPETLQNNSFIKNRLAGVREARLKSPTPSVQEYASKPYLFTQDRQPNSSYIAIPEVSSERRDYIPIAYLDANVIASNKIYMMLSDDLYFFSILCSSIHNAWMRAVCGRMKSDYSYAPAIFYNLPNITNLSDANKDLLREAAKTILDARALYPNSTLANLYDPLTMPVELVKAHQANNKAVDEAYGYKGGDDDASRVAFLFKRYEELTSLLPATVVKKKRAKKQEDAQTDLI